MKITKRQLRKIIREEKVNIIKENYYEKEPNFLDDNLREQKASDMVEHMIRYLQSDFPDQDVFDELMEDISAMLYDYEAAISRKQTQG